MKRRDEEAIALSRFYAEAWQSKLILAWRPADGGDGLLMPPPYVVKEQRR